MIKAKRLEKGNTIGVVSPASPSENRSEIVRAREYLENLGYKVVIGRNVNKTKGFTAASEQERADDINEMFAREDIDAVFATQGGYGSAQIIDKLDYELIRSKPKIFTGFSDITSLHLAIQKFSGLVTFYSPGMARFNEEDLSEYINGKIRNHEDVRLIAEDGDILILTSKSAAKLSSIYDNSGRTLSEDAFERKANGTRGGIWPCLATPAPMCGTWWATPDSRL